MIIFPAIDVLNKKAVRLFKGEYDKKTEYGDPAFFAEEFKKQGATHIHTVDLDGAKAGFPVNFDTIVNVKKTTGLFVEVGGGIREMKTAENYINAGIDRVILGTSAIRDMKFLETAVRTFGEKIAVGADIKNGYIAVNGWTESSEEDVFSFLRKMEGAGVKTVICTDVSKDGVMRGANIELYEKLTFRFSLDIIASGGVSDIDDIIALKSLGLYGAIVGKAYYSGKISILRAIEVAR